MRMLKNKRALFWLILAAAVFTRAVCFGDVPGGVNQDEAMAGVDAWALSQYGTDRFGVWLPVHFEAWTNSQMSVLLSYCMIPFIKIFGFGILAVRLPMLIVSCCSVALVYLTGQRLWGRNAALTAMFLTAVNPWHFMQSRWSLDCNLFPHVFLLAFYLLLLGLEKRRYLYLAMLFFGLTFYCYGIAVYSVTPFLAVFAAWCLWKKRLRLREVLICAAIFTAIALPEIIVMAINLFGWNTIKTPFFTLSRFPLSTRGNDILFLNFSFGQLGRNALSLLKSSILQTPDNLFNAMPAFGPMYHISIPFMLIGIGLFTRDLFREKNIKKQTDMLALWGFLLTGIWVGVITYEVNINRVNIIFYPLIFFCTYGLCAAAGRFRALQPVSVCAYGLCFALFLTGYFTYFRREIQTYFNVNFLRVVSLADAMEDYERIYITGHMDWQYNLGMAEILTQYACKIDAGYYQKRTNVTGGRELLTYPERYHFVDLDYPVEADPDGLYLFHVTELEKIPFVYEIVLTDANYILVTAHL